MLRRKILAQIKKNRERLGGVLEWEMVKNAKRERKHYWTGQTRERGIKKAAWD